MLPLLSQIGSITLMLVLDWTTVGTNDVFLLDGLCHHPAHYESEQSGETYFT